MEIRGLLGKNLEAERSIDASTTIISHGGYDCASADSTAFLSDALPRVGITTAIEGDLYANVLLFSQVLIVR